MPKIRDWTWQYGTSISATTLACSLPEYKAGDLLMAICTTDTGTTQSWSSSGWTQYLSLSNASNIGILYKIAGTNEASPVIAYSIAETADIRVVSIMDVDTAAPFNANANKNTVSLGRDTMPTVTTNRDNCLIIYAAANSGAGVPTIIEGAVTFEAGSDGSAHSDGLSWGFQSIAGTTPTDVYYTTVSIGASKLITVAINPPSTGATVIPAYCAGDSSLYLDPLHGTTAYNGNAAFDAKATTYFSTTLDGRPLANGTIAAAADVGINSFHSMAQITGVTTNGTYTGATSVMAPINKPKVSGKNVLVHIKPSTPKQLQTTDPITKSTSKGIGFGMCSTANTDYRVWHVHGAGTAWGSAQHLPVVINSDTTKGLLQSTGTLDPTSITAFGFFTSGFSVATVWQFGSLWVLDTTTIAGGTTAEPVGIAGINKVCSTGKERMSVLQQGASQALILQPVQFGNGGSNQVILDLDSTAIEFPEQYNVSSKQVFYCSADNVAGLTYYAGASDAIKHTNAVVSSKSPFHWQIHASSSPSAAYDFSGLSIIGAGDVQLRDVTTFSEMSFTNCTLITQNNASIDSGLFKNSYIKSNNPERLTLCSFTSGGIGHAIEITTPGTYSFIGNTFSSYGTTGTTNAAIYNNSGGAVTLNISGNGSTPTVRNGSGASTTIDNLVTVTLEANVSLAGSEIRIYDLDNSPAGSLGTEITGSESCLGSTFNFSSAGANTVWIQVMKTGYEEFGMQYKMPTTNSPLSITLKADINT